MRILIVTQYFWPEQFRVNDIADFLIKKGNHVDILTCHPSYPSANLYDDYLNNKKKPKKFKKINIFRLPVFKRREDSDLSIILNYITFVISGLFLAPFYLKDKKYDVVFTFATSPVTSAVVSIFIAFLKKSKHIIWILDIWPQILKELRIIKNKYLYKLINKIIDLIYINSDLIFTQSKSFKTIIENNLLQNYSNTNKNIVYLPSWSEELIFKNQIENKFNYEKFKNKFNIVFTGNVGEAQNFDNIIKAAVILKKNKKIQWVIVGSGRKLNQISLLVKKNKIDNFIIEGHKAIKKIPSYHKIANLLLVSLKKNKYLSSTIPGKVQSYMQSNKFILGYIAGETKNLINESKTGIVIDPNRPDLLAKAIIKLQKNIKIIKSYEKSKLGSRFVLKNFNKNVLLNKIFNDIKNTLEIFKLIPNSNLIPFDRNFSLSGLNLAFLGYWLKGKINISKDVYLWPDGLFYKRFFRNVRLNKIAGRDLILNLKIPDFINKIYVFGNLEKISKEYLQKKFKKKVLHIPLSYGDSKTLYRNYYKIKFTKKDLIFLTLPTPKQEEFAQEIMKNNKYFKILCIGGAINMLSGVEKKIPQFLDNLNLEFVWRLRTDTLRRVRRLISTALRYLIGEVQFKFSNINKKIIR